MRQAWDTPGQASYPGRFSEEVYDEMLHDRWLAHLSQIFTRKRRPSAVGQAWCSWCKKEPKYARGLCRRDYQRWLRRYARGTTGLVGL